MKTRVILMLTATILTASSSSHAADAAATPGDSPANTNAVDVTLPLSELPAMQWIVVTNGDTLQIMPATGRGTPDGVVVSAHAAGVTPDTLRAAVVRTHEGGTVTSALKPGS